MAETQLRVRLLRGKTDEWLKSSAVLLEGELGIDLESKILKIGDGVKTWKDLNSIVEDGKTPYIKNGFWYIGDTNTEVKAVGLPGDQGKQGEKGDRGDGLLEGLQHEGESYISYQDLYNAVAEEVYVKAYPSISNRLNEIKDGESAYQVAVRATGFQGTEVEWIQSLRISQADIDKIDNRLSDKYDNLRMIMEGLWIEGNQLITLDDYQDLVLADQVDPNITYYITTEPIELNMPLVSTTKDGFMSKADKIKLDSIDKSKLDSLPTNADLTTILNGKLNKNGTEWQPIVLNDTEDINNRKTPGTYFNLYPATVVNGPSGVSESFTMEILPLPHNSCSQDIYTYDDNLFRRYRRFFESGTWSNWKQVEGLAEVKITVKPPETVDFSDVAYNSLIFVRES